MKSDQSKLYSHVEFITGVTPARNYRNMESLNKVADYIAVELKNSGCSVTEQPFEVQGRTYRNIIGSIGPENAPRIIVGAHYDVAGDQPGADDNASAVAGLLETARLLALKSPELTKRIDFVAYNLEEPPFFSSDDMGSAVHANSLKRDGVEVEFMVCYEMIGYFSDEPGSQSFPDPSSFENTYTDTGNFITVVGIQSYSQIAEKLTSLMRDNSDIRVECIVFQSYAGLAGLSDQRNYWANGYPAVMLTDTSFLRNHNYHQVTDTIDTLDFNRMGEVVNGISGALLALG